MTANIPQRTTTSRPLMLDPLFKSVKALPGVGPKNALLFEKLAGPMVKDLLFHLPSGFINREFISSLKHAVSGHIGTLMVTVVNHIPSSIRSKPYRVRCHDEESNVLDLVFFHANKKWILSQLPLNEKRVVSGRVDFFQGIAQIVHPDFIGKKEELEQATGLETLYPLTTGLTPKIVRKTIHRALKELPDLPEWQDPSFIKTKNWPSFNKALKTLHHPTQPEQLEPQSTTRQRLAYDEFLSTQLTLALVRHHHRRSKGRLFKPSTKLRAQLIKNLPFSLTTDQEKALDDIDKDMQQDKQMLRLIQGDVGSGKTIVAIIAALSVIESGSQAAMMAPTEILATQHYESTKKWCDILGIHSCLLTGSDKTKTKATKLEEIKSGSAQLIFGTHALFQDKVSFHDLALVVIDEQHRFGVHQRLTLSAKGNRPDVLVMTATPIPRSLRLTTFGDMDVSRIVEKPKGRQPIDTKLVSILRLDEVIERLQTKIAIGEKIYWVCPLVEESEKIDLAAAEERYDQLNQLLGEHKVGLVHGRMKSHEKEATMEEFKNGSIKLLVSTTVIEVGLDVPDATVMIIEQAERFGLSQLHQLRGRVGRSDKQSTCLLLYAPNIGENAKARLQIMRETNDGFLIAEKDLKLRGAGDLLGVRQSGLPVYKMASISDYPDLIQTAFNDARLIISQDPFLQSERGQSLKYLLYLMNCDQAIQLLRSG